MSNAVRIAELCSQLLRAENPAVLETVAAQLQEAVALYVQHFHRHSETLPLFETLLQRER